MSRQPLTPADKVTLARAGLGAIGGVFVVLGLVGVVPLRSWIPPLLFAAAFSLDAVDGAVARRTGTVTARGARWDNEVDAAVLLVACLGVIPSAPWALAIGSARYLFWLGGRMRPAWRGALPASTRRRVIGGLQCVAVVVAMAPIVPSWLAQAVTGGALVLLLFSFGRDIWHQERTAR